MCVCMYAHNAAGEAGAVEFDLTGTGWRRCMECLKFLVSFRKRATNYRALLLKTTYEDKASDASSPPCMGRVHIYSLQVRVRV